MEVLNSVTPDVFSFLFGNWCNQSENCMAHNDQLEFISYFANFLCNRQNLKDHGIKWICWTTWKHGNKHLLHKEKWPIQVINNEINDFWTTFRIALHHNASNFRCDSILIIERNSIIGECAEPYKITIHGSYKWLWPTCKAWMHLKTLRKLET